MYLWRQNIVHWLNNCLVLGQVVFKSLFSIHVLCELSPTNHVSVCYSSSSLKLVFSGVRVTLWHINLQSLNMCYASKYGKTVRQANKSRTILDGNRNIFCRWLITFSHKTFLCRRSPMTEVILCLCHTELKLCSKKGLIPHISFMFC